MKQYITTTQFKTDFLRGADLLEQMNDENILFFIGLASNRVDTLTNRFVEKAIRSGLYINTDGALTLDPAMVPEDSTVEEEQAKLDAVKEAVAMLTKFGTDTGYDFIQGSIAVNLGAESFQETLDFETSIARVEKMVKELLATFDFNVLLESGTIKMANEEDDGETPPPAFVSGSDRPITISQYKTHHANDHVNGGGIIIDKNEQTGQVTLRLDPDVVSGNLSVEDDEIIKTQETIADMELAYDDNLNTEPQGGN